MKTQTKNIILNLSFMGLLTASISAQASFIVDTKIGQALLGNSSDATELAAIESASGISDLTLDFKTSAFTVLQNPGTTDQWYIDITPNAPGYFLLKFGIGGTSATADTFFFQNLNDLTKLVWSNSQVQFLTGGDCGAHNQNACNTGRLSHYNLYNSGTPPTQDVDPIPEPASVLLLGMGLLGWMGFFRRQSKSALTA
ncbi:MAG: PEP-CTERM sorting domain-containing protein [Methylobacter sp.]|nr:PEP-CTERM sorting domain-containing protein [Methylobacter sp.]